MYTHPFFEATPPGAAPGPPVNTGARVRHFRGCNKNTEAAFSELSAECSELYNLAARVQAVSYMAYYDDKTPRGGF